MAVKFKDKNLCAFRKFQHIIDSYVLRLFCGCLVSPKCKLRNRHRKVGTAGLN